MEISRSAGSPSDSFGGSASGSGGVSGNGAFVRGHRKSRSLASRDFGAGTYPINPFETPGKKQRRTSFYERNVDESPRTDGDVQMGGNEEVKSGVGKDISEDDAMSAKQLQTPKQDVLDHEDYSSVFMTRSKMRRSPPPVSPGF